MKDSRASYRQIMKATSLFGGVQVFNIIISIIRSKFIAILLGPEGMGIAGLLNSVLGIITGLTNFGLGTSAVKDIASANGTGDIVKIASVIKVFRRLVWLTGTLGAVVTFVLSSLLSELTFGSHEYTLAFAWLSVTLLLSQLSSGQLVVLQGMRKLRYLAKANVAGSLFGLIVTIPLYYLYGIDAIVPAIIISAISSLLLSWFFARRIKFQPVTVSYLETVNLGKKMLTMGFMINLSGLVGLGTAYIVRIYIGNYGGLTDVGLYTAGFAIINNYVGIVFNAMGADYYPKLSFVAHDNELSKDVINKQTEIGLLVICPVIIVFIVCIKWVIVFLYSNQFGGIDEMIRWAALGMLFRVTSWSLGFFILAKGASKIYFLNALPFEAFFLVTNIFGYRFCGLAGLGMSFIFGYLVSSIQVFIVCRIVYNFSFNLSVIRIFSIQFMLATSCLLAEKFLSNPYQLFVGVMIIGLSVCYSYDELDSRIGVKSIISKAIFKK